MSSIDDFDVNDVVTAGDVTYVGKEDKSGRWCVQKVDESSGTVITYATVLNNAEVTSYAAAWAARESLTYGTAGAAFR